MKSLFLSLIVLFSLELRAADGTEAKLKEYKKNGLELFQEKQIENIQVKLYLAQNAKDAIAKGAFLVPDPEFNQELLNAFILERFESSLKYFQEIGLQEEIKELHLIIMDEGGDKETISETTQSTRVIELHLVRWHKYFKRNQKSNVDLSSIHEFGHVINSIYSPNEKKLHREMVATMVECLNLIQIYTLDTFTKNYLKSFGQKVTDLSQIRQGTYLNMAVVRNLAFVFFKNLYNGTYKSTLENDARKVSESFTMSYLKNPLDDEEGFNDSIKEKGLIDVNGNDLTFKTLQEDTIKELTF